MSELIYEKKDHIAVFTLNRPEKFNALSPVLLHEFQSALQDFLTDNHLFVGIVTGMGEKAFCAGADVKTWLPFVKKTADRPWEIPDTPMRGMKVNKPLIAAVNGLALGGGAELALSCDIRIASDRAVFRFPEPQLGILPRFGGTQRLPRIIGYGRAMEILLTNEKVDAEKALRIGLVSEVVSEEILMETSFKWAEKICNLAPLAVRNIKKCVEESYNKPLYEGLELENELGMALYATDDYQEGSTAFKEKRKPVFKGR